MDLILWVLHLDCMSVFLFCFVLFCFFKEIKSALIS